MLSIVDAFARSIYSEGSGNPQLLNFLGCSYGTFLGQTFASMFPDRVGRMVLDSVVDPDDWVSGSFGNDLTSSDAAFSTFFQYCNLAGPTQCPFHTGSTPRDVYLRFEKIMSQLNAAVAAERKLADAIELENALADMRHDVFTQSYYPILNFPKIAQYLVGVEGEVSTHLRWTDEVLQRLHSLYKKHF